MNELSLTELARAVKMLWQESDQETRETFGRIIRKRFDADFAEEIINTLQSSL